jgi:hypothetical protein
MKSAAELASRLVTSTTSPSQRLLREEARQHVQTALGHLSPRDCQVLELCHLEQLSVAETAAVLGISEGAVKTRHIRALQRLRSPGSQISSRQAKRWTWRFNNGGWPRLPLIRSMRLSSQFGHNPFRQFCASLFGPAPCLNG